MAEYETHVDEETGITFIEVTGKIVIEEHMPFVRSESFGERTLLLVHDLRDASLDGMSRGTLAKMVRAVRPLGKSGVRAAYVVNSGEDFSKGKLFLAQLEVLDYEGKFRLFTDMKKAIAWVRK